MCIFCQIINHEIPSHNVYENDDVFAILDISQVTKGHTLVMPKKHYANIFECDEQTMVEVMKVAKMLGEHIMKTTGADGMNILSNIHEVAGQSVDHFHVHLIPRYSENDAVEITFHESDKQDLSEVLKLIKY